MSCRRPKLTYKRRRLAPPVEENANSLPLISVADAPRPKRPRNSKGLFLPGPEELIALPGGVSLTQPIANGMPTCCTKDSSAAQGTRHKRSTSLLSRSHDEDILKFNYPSESNAEIEHDDALKRQNRQLKKARMSSKWTTTVLPSLLPIYLRLLRETQSLRLSPNDISLSCTQGCGSIRALTVTCIFFQRIGSIIINVCTCSPAAVQLLSKGLFPCAPSFPSLAVDIPLLEFTRKLFVRIPPNVTSFTEAIESFLKPQGYSINEGDIRRRFGNARKWYSVLCDMKHDHVQTVLRPATLDSRPATLDSQAEYESETRLGRPTEYLRQRCPLCFGGRLSHELGDTNPDIIVCLDACFTQKRRKGSGDSDYLMDEKFQPSIFLTESEVSSMEIYVNQRRSARAANGYQESCHDGYEGSLKVPSSVLDGCNESFTAADERRQKASTQFFADTGLMAILCRHDRPLWLANMTTAGEKQFYALALIKKLFEHIPLTVTVGLLYDIACQLHRSVAKNKFLPHILPRLSFGISVFHAYGHQWPCQVIYHPRKCRGFGLSDGEGCERFWSSIGKLIPSLRMSGYHQRLYILDAQVRHQCQTSLHNLGDWLVRKWYRCLELKREAEFELRNIGISISVLRDQWSKQVNKQTRPAPRQSKLAGKREVEALVILEQNLKSSRQHVRQLQARIIEDTAHGSDVVDIALELQELRESCASMAEGVRQKRAALGVSQRAALSRIQDDTFVQLRVNARALKTRIRDRLRQRKFELEPLERSARHVKDRKLASNVESAIKRREPGIMKLAKMYNDLCAQMQSRVRHGNTRRNVALPLPINVQKLFSLDIDDEIWQDAGLNDDDDDGTVDLWLEDSKTRDGIKWLLALDRCIEEEVRLQKERTSMQEWMYEEWSTLQRAYSLTDLNEDTVYQLDIQRRELLGLCRRWQPLVQVIPGNECRSPWGPSLEDLLIGSDADLLAEGSGDEEQGSDVSFDSDSSSCIHTSGEEDLIESVALSEIYDGVADEDYS